MITAECPLCCERIDLGLILKHGQALLCPVCQAMLEVVSLKPVKLDWIYFDERISEDTNIKKARTTKCPFCQYEFDAPRRLRPGQGVLCPSCDVEVEVVWLNPVELG